MRVQGIGFEFRVICHMCIARSVILDFEWCRKSQSHVHGHGMAFQVTLIFTRACAGYRCVSGQCWGKSEDDRTGNANYTKS